MEDRRLVGCRMMAEGAAQAVVARQCGVSRTTASRWAAAVAKGADLRSRKGTGRPCRLTPEQLLSLFSLWETREKWTSTEFAEAIRQTTGVQYDPDHVSRLIVRLGLRLRRQRRAHLGQTFEAMTANG